MAQLDRLPDELRRVGVPFTEHPGWHTRGRAVLRARGLVCHHTAGAKTGDLPSLRILIDGRPDVPGPLCNVALGRETVRIIAAGTANHAGAGGWRGLVGNSSVVGIEGESTGTGDWTPFQRWAYPRVSLAIARACGFGAEMVCDHREWTSRKIDPVGFGRGELRQSVARLMAGVPEPIPPKPKEDTVVATVSWGPERLDIFVRGTNDALWHRWREAGVWSEWESLGGKVLSVAASSPAPGRLDVVAKGTNGAVWHKGWDGAWSAWHSLGGQVGG